jgi:hypothetical protein
MDIDTKETQDAVAHAAEIVITVTSLQIVAAHHSLWNDLALGNRTPRFDPRPPSTAQD